MKNNQLLVSKTTLEDDVSKAILNTMFEEELI